MIIEQPGLYKNISNEDYHKSKGISNSGIRNILDCPKVYWYKYLSGEYDRKKSGEFTLGSAVHTIILEPDTFYDRFYITTKMDRRTKEGKAEYAYMLRQSNGKEILEEDDYKQALSMANNITNHAMFKKVKGGHIEDSIMWQDPESGALLRSRPDYYNDFLILDIKTTKDVRPRPFSNSIVDYGYHSQAAMACDGLTAVTGIPYEMVVLFVVSKEPPYLVQPYVLTAQALQQGRDEYKRGAALYQKCLTSGNWPAYEEVILDIDLPRWSYRSEQNVE
jgi:exodeoxyribonuclease VIII